MALLASRKDRAGGMKSVAEKWARPESANARPCKPNPTSFFPHRPTDLCRSLVRLSVPSAHVDASSRNRNSPRPADLPPHLPHAWAGRPSAHFPSAQTFLVDLLVHCLSALAGCRVERSAIASLPTWPCCSRLPACARPRFAGVRPDEGPRRRRCSGGRRRRRRPHCRLPPACLAGPMVRGSLRELPSGDVWVRSGRWYGVASRRIRD
jgi:hypothetical protein